MRDNFIEFYRPTPAEFDVLWSEATFSFDTNVLLHVYRYTPETCQRLLEIIEKVADRIWLSYQAGSEFHKNRITVINAQKRAYGDLKKRIFSQIEVLKSELIKDFGRHTLLDAQAICNELDKASNEIDAMVNAAEVRHPNYLDSDPLVSRLNSLFDGKIGERFSSDKMESLFKEGEKRFAQNIPPGYEDVKPKKDNSKYGDFVLWTELLEYAKVTKKPIIFVTDDSKEDWFLKSSGMTIGPRPELMREMIDCAGVKLYIYQTDQFMEQAGQYFGLVKQDAAIEEVRRVRDQPDLTDELTFSDDEWTDEELSEYLEEDFKKFLANKKNNPQKSSSISHSENFAIGERVNHGVFGIGTVLDYVGLGGDAIVTVAFQHLGVKKLLAGYARLKKI